MCYFLLKILKGNIDMCLYLVSFDTELKCCWFLKLNLNLLRLSDAYTLKWKCHHVDKIFITGCTGSCQNDNFQCSQWRKFDQNDNISTWELASVKHAIIAAPDDGLPPVRHQAIIWTNTAILLIIPWATYFSERLFKSQKVFIQRNALENIIYRMVTILMG